jgi:hypothetical protein
VCSGELACTNVTNEWSYTSTLTFAFKGRCLIKRRTVLLFISVQHFEINFVILSCHKCGSNRYVNCHRMKLKSNCTCANSNMYNVSITNIYIDIVCVYVGHFIMFSVITNIYNKTKGPTLMELFTATGKRKVFF